MNWKQIETFRVAMLTRSMTVAATQLHTSQPNVSRIIGQLEGEVGFRLFERRSNGLLPTPEAEAFHQAVQRLYMGMGELADTARQIRDIGAGTLRIGAMPSLVMSVMPKVMQAFRGRYPDAQVSIYSSDSSTVAKWVSTRHVDLGLVSNLIETPGVVSTLWATEDGVCIVPAGHRLAKKKAVVSSDLENEPFISFTKSDVTRSTVDAAFEAADKRRLTLEAPYAMAICEMVGLGLGVSIVNPLVVRHADLQGVKVLPFKPGIPFSRYVLVPQQQADSALMTAFLECLEKVGGYGGKGRSVFRQSGIDGVAR
jgi:DNA-binding transcriptional LysR family regulator